MKTIVPILVLALLAGSGCASRYSIILNNGNVITAKGKPHYDRDRGAWFYKDASGQPAKVPGGDVKEVSPSSLAGGDSPTFNSSFQRQ